MCIMKAVGKVKGKLADPLHRLSFSIFPGLYREEVKMV